MGRFSKGTQERNDLPFRSKGNRLSLEEGLPPAAGGSHFLAGETEAQREGTTRAQNTQCVGDLKQKLNSGEVEDTTQMPWFPGNQHQGLSHT